MTPCARCQKEIPVTSRNKKFCSLDCFTTSPAFKQAQLNRKTGVEHECLYCATSFYTTKSYAHRKYCSMACYKKHKAVIFDANIVTGDDLKTLNNYDEFMVKPKLTCPFVGCDWVGDHLGQHVSKAHDISARRFKQLAGFNLTEGLRTLALKETALNTTYDCTKQLAALILGRTKDKTKTGYVSRQGDEARKKIAALIKNSPERTCVCAQCGVKFIGTWQQHNRSKKGKTVCCGTTCRQTLISHSRLQKEN
jgi:hypothetical protein